LEEKTSGNKKMYSYRDENNNIIPLNSLVDSKKEIHEFLKGVTGKKFVILIGGGDGTVINEWIEKINSYIHLLIIEPFDEVKINEETFSKVYEHANITYIHHSQLKPLYFVSFAQLFQGTETEILIHPNYIDTNVSLLKDIISSLRQGVKMAQINKNTKHYFRKDWIIEPIINLEYTLNLTSINELKDEFIGKAAILVSSGPSLIENIEFIKNSRSSAYIFAAGSAVNGLLNFGIQPDFVTVFDSSIINYEAHFKDIEYNGPLIIQGIVNSNILKNHKGTAILCDTNIDNITKLKRSNIHSFPPVQSVALFSMQILEYLGFSEVYLVGQDLALKNGDYYSKGVHNHENVNNRAEEKVESNSGGLVETTFSLYSQLQIFNDFIYSLNKKMKVYNTAEHGAKIEGVPYVVSKDIDFTYYKKDVVLDLVSKNTSNSNIVSIKDIITKLDLLLSDVHKSIDKLNERHISQFNLVISMIEVIKNLREHSIFEKVIIEQLSFDVQKINNIFMYELERENYAESDILKMLMNLQTLLNKVNYLLKDIFADSNFLNLKERVYRY
jgi:hypothetical protein